MKHYGFSKVIFDLNTYNKKIDMNKFLELDNKGHFLSIDKIYNSQDNIVYLDVTHSVKVKKNYNKINLLFYIDFENISDYNEYKKVIYRIIRVKKLCIKKNINIGTVMEKDFVVGTIKNYDPKNKYHNDVIAAINAVLINKLKEKYTYIYNKVCQYLDDEFIEKNLCGFENDKCIAKKDTNCTMGCCHHFKNRLDIFLFKDMQVCSYLKNNTCEANCMSCKLFTCDYLVKQGIKFRIKDILLAECFFNIAQKVIIKTRLFTPREKIIKEIMFLHF